MGRRSKEEETAIIDAVKKFGAVYNDDQLAQEIMKAGKLTKPPSPRSVRRWRRKILSEYTDCKTVRLPEQDIVDIFNDSLETYRELKRQCNQDIRRANALSIYKTIIDRKDTSPTFGQVVFQRDPNGHLIQDINATRNRNYMLAKARYQLQSAQYQIDRLMRETGNFVPKVEKPADEHHYHLNINLFKIGLKNVIRIITPLLMRQDPLTQGEIQQLARVIEAEFSTEEGAEPLLGSIGLQDVELLKPGDIENEIGSDE